MPSTSTFDTRPPLKERPECRTRVLVVHPDDEVAAALQMMLRRSGLETLTVSDVQAAERVSVRWAPHAIILQRPETPCPESEPPGGLDRLTRAGAVPIVHLRGEHDAEPGNSRPSEYTLCRPFSLSKLTRMIGTMLHESTSH